MVNLLELTKKLQSEISILSQLPHVSLNSGHKRRLEELVASPLEEQTTINNNTKRIKRNHLRHYTSITHDNVKSFNNKINVKYESNLLLEPAVFF